MKKTLRFTLCTCLLSSMLHVHAQQNMTLYNMEQLSARSSLNPALMNHSRININLPGVSNSFLSCSNSSFAYSDLVRRSADDSLYIDLDNLVSKLKRSNYLSLALETDVLAFGFRIRNSYIGVNATEKIQARFAYPDELIRFIKDGNGGMLGQQVNLAFRLDAIHYREYGLSFTQLISHYLSVGARVKYLYGMENIHTGKSTLSLYTDPSTYAITARSNIQINTSGLDGTDRGNQFSFSDYAFHKNNHGFALDLGFNYKLNGRFTAGGSILDLGAIRWKDAVTSYASTRPDAEFTYSGIDINQVTGDTGTYSQALDHALDTLFTSLHVDTVHGSYQTALSPQVYLSGNYILDGKHQVGLLLYNRFDDKTMHPAASLSFNKMFGKWLNVAVSYTVVNRTYNNIGFGIALNDYDVQLFAVTDNVMGVIFPQKARNTNIRAGINLRFGNNSYPLK